MPPKKPAAAAPSKKTDVKKKEKLVEDKTFGLKNKKGSKQQKYIQNVQKSTIPQQKPNEQKTKKEEKLKELEELNKLFKPVVQKVDKGVDPKSVLCAFFKQGTCSKGDKCKFSHDLAIANKAQKKSMFVDVRDEDTMENWDDEKLAEVIEKKHGEKERSMPKTDIICKFFLDAVESSKYGWFWECENGASCHYRHALPPGYVLKKDLKKEKKEEISIEDLVERERAALGYNLTPVTLGSFLAWKQRKTAEKKAKHNESLSKKEVDFKAGRHVGLSGKDMFLFNPDLVQEEDLEGEVTFDNLKREDIDDIDVKELDLDALAKQAREADGTGSKVSRDARQFQAENGAVGGATAAELPADIDADLFGDEEDLEDLEKELEALQTEG